MPPQLRYTNKSLNFANVRDHKRTARAKTTSCSCNTQRLISELHTKRSAEDNNDDNFAINIIVNKYNKYVERNHYEMSTVTLTKGGRNTKHEVSYAAQLKRDWQQQRLLEQTLQMRNLQALSSARCISFSCTNSLCCYCFKGNYYEVVHHQELLSLLLHKRTASVCMCV